MSVPLHRNIALFICSLVVLLFVPSQSDWIVLFTSWAGAWAGFLLLYRKGPSISLRSILLLALFVRVIALGSIPNLSDDYIRFLWDGELLSEGINPYLFTPSQWFSEEQLNFFSVLYDRLNSPDYHSVYPPAMQLVFLLGSLGNSIFSSILSMKIILFVGECVTLGVLYRFPGGISRKAFLLYALNPLIISEGIGNIHFELLAVSFIALAIYAMKAKNWKLAGMGLGTAVGVKLNPLLFLPLSFRYFNRFFKGYRFLFWTVVSAVILLSPLIVAGGMEGFLESLRLYFQTFEFNAGVYYAIRDGIAHWTGYNPIAALGPVLGSVGILIILIISFYPGKMSFQQCIERWQWGFLIYLLCSTIIHPWYIIPLVFLSAITELKFPVVWSFCIVLSYSLYGMGDTMIHTVLLWIEYILLGIAVVWDIKKASGTKQFFRTLSNNEGAS